MMMMEGVFLCKLWFPRLMKGLVGRRGLTNGDLGSDNWERDGHGVVSIT